MWPKKTEYQQAVKNPAGAFDDPDLTLAQPEIDPATGLPHVQSGGQGAVFILKGFDQTKIAVRCFLIQTVDRQGRYAAIKRGLNVLKHEPLSPFPDFDYLQKGICVHGVWYPVIKMPMAQGQLLSDFIRDNFRNSEKMRRLSQQWLAVSRLLRREQIAHGNLQPSNIFVDDDKITFVDLDGVFVPALQGRQSEELGAPDYQHPQRTHAHFGAYLDNFSDWVIYTSLVALSADARFSKFLDLDQKLLLFRRSDFVSIAESEVFFRMKNHTSPELKSLGASLEQFASLSPDKIPALSPPSPVFVQSTNTFDTIPGMAAVTLKDSVARLPVTDQPKPAVKRRHKDVLDLDELDTTPASGGAKSENLQRSHPSLVNEGGRGAADDFSGSFSFGKQGEAPPTAAAAVGFGSSAETSFSLGSFATPLDSPAPEVSLAAEGKSKLRGLEASTVVQPQKKSSSALPVILIMLLLFGGAVAGYILLLKPDQRSENTSTTVSTATATASYAPSNPESSTAGPATSTASTNNTTSESSTTSGTNTSSTVDAESASADLVKEGAGLVKEKNFKEAVAKFSEAIKLNSADATAYGARAEAYLMMKRHAEALEDFDKALSIDPDNKSYIKGRGASYLWLEQYLKAAADLKKALIANPEDPEILRDLGKSYGGLGEFQQALSYFDQSLDRKADANTYYLRGGTHYCLKKYNEALADYRKAVALNPKDADAWYGIGSCLYCFKKYSEAREPYRKAVELYTASGKVAWANKARSFLTEVSRTK